MNRALLATPRSTRQRVVHALLELWRRLRPPVFSPGMGPVDLNFCVHAEAVAQETTFEALLALVGWFRRTAGVRAVVGVTTPRCPQTARLMATVGTEETTFAGRVKRIADEADLAYHGHFFDTISVDDRAMVAERERFSAGPMRALWEPDLVPIGPRTLLGREAVVRAQMLEELAWFAEKGFKVTAYTAGWWFLPPVVVKTLEANGVVIDCSLRFDGRNTFGGTTLAQPPPPGLPVRVPPATHLVSLPNLVGATVSPLRVVPKMTALAQLAHHAPRVGLLHFHDYDLPAFRREVEAHVSCWSSYPDVFRWMPLEAMAAQEPEAVW
ncbi:hypothetical protein MYX64_00795 [Nitrospinae bacterium AH_259_B05_G02_I21]|nr:hypothetical protein [Nitrospinae bacterium AH_259_B05_G02_I21]MDA2931915.1 hypothetical protein [Nitrospinae bacterium AH-259-F20]